MKSIYMALLLVVVSASIAYGQDDKYCGIYAAFGAAQALDVDFEFEDLIAEKYVSNERGSAAIDIHKAAEAMGLKARSWPSLACESLYSAENPMILHVMSDGQVEAYNHWVLFLGFSENGDVRLVETPGEIHEGSLSTLLGRWDGNAIEIYREHDSPVSFNNIHILYYCWMISITVTLAMGFMLIANRYFPGSLKNWIQIIGPVICLMVLIGASTGSTTTNASTFSYLESAARSGRFPEVNFPEIRDVVENSPSMVLLVDARHPTNASQGSIPGSKNIPYFASNQQLKELTKGIDRETKLIVYCESYTCSFDNLLAIRLTGLGFDSVKVYSGGWKEWTEK